MKIRWIKTKKTEKSSIKCKINFLSGMLFAKINMKMKNKNRQPLENLANTPPHILFVPHQSPWRKRKIYSTFWSIYFLFITSIIETKRSITLAESDTDDDYIIYAEQSNLHILRQFLHIFPNLIIFMISFITYSDAG